MEDFDISTVPKDGSWFFVRGGWWQTDDQSHGFKNDGWVRVRYIEPINAFDSPFRTETADAIDKPDAWKWMKDAPQTIDEAKQVICDIHNALLAFRNPEFDMIKHGMEGVFDDAVKRVLSMSAPTIAEDRF